MVICKYFQQGCCKYGNNCRFEHVFGSKYSYSRGPQQQQNTIHQNNVFNQASSNSASSLFRSAVQSNVPSVFGQSNVNRPSVFNRLGQSNSNNNQAKSIFAQATQNVFPQANPQIPAQVLNHRTNPRSVFAQANQNAFAHQHHNIIVPQQNNAPNLFASAAQNVFNTQNNVSNPTALPTNVFHIISKPLNVFSNANSSFDSCDENLYSNLEDLAKSDIEAFESLDFKLGFIPELPPPRALCV